MPDGASTISTAPTGTVTFLFTDIEGSTRLLERLHGAYADVLAEHRRILRDAFARWNGHEVDTQGDSFFVAFSRASDALSCAVDAQRALSKAKWPDGADVRVRMGIHTGEPLVAGADYVGMEVHRAARIAAAGHGGQVLVSGTTFDLIADELPQGVKLADLGTYKLKDMRRETRLYQASMEGLRDDFAPLVTSPTEEPAPTPGDPPYRGLQAFDLLDADQFFGRDEIVAELAERVRDSRFLALIGASGSGKSSILRAGLIATLRRQQPTIRILLLTPTAHPLEELAGALRPDAAGSQIAGLADEMRAEPRTLAAELRKAEEAARGKRTRTLIAVDQLEEVFTLCRDEVERQAFLAALVHASGVNDGPANTPADADRAAVIVTLRADFYAYLAPYAQLRAAAAASQMYVGAMSSDELRLAIEEPARRGGWEFVPGLVELLLRDVGDEPGALPLLSHALLETWQRRRGTTMTLRSYAESGGVKGAIARTADRVYETEFSDGQRRIAHDIFVRLTELGEGAQDTRRRARLDELMPKDDSRATDVRGVIGALADARLVTVGEETVEVAHEALIREWPTLREWLRTDRDSLRIHRRLTEAATEWEVSGQDESQLFRGARLAQTRESTEYKGALNPLEQRFLDASIESEERQQVEREAAEKRELEAAQALAAEQSQRAAEAARSNAQLRRRALLLTGVLALAAVLAGAALVLARQSDANASLAAQRAQEAQDNAALADQRAAEARDNAALADQRAQEAHDSEAIAQTESTQALAQRLGSDATQVMIGGRDPELSALLALNALRVGYTPQADAALQRAGRRLSGDVYQHDAPVDSMVVTPDQATMITLSDSTIRIWDVATGLVRSSFEAPFQSQDAYLELSNDGRILLATQYGGAAMVYELSASSPTTARPIAADCPAISAPNGIRTLSGDGKVLATALTGQSTAGNVDDVVVVTIPDCLPVADPFPLPGLNDPTLNVDGSLLAGSLQEAAVMVVLDLAAGEQRSQFGSDIGQFWHSDFSADGNQLLIGSFDGTAHIYDTNSGDLLHTFRGHSAGVIRAVFSSDGSRVLTSSFDHTARLWEISGENEVRRFVHSDEVLESAISAGGENVFTASADGTARRWLAGDTAEEYTFAAADAEVGGLSFSPDGQRLAAAGGDNTRIFSLESGSLIVDESTRSSKRVAFSPDGMSVLIASSFGTSLMDAQTGALIRRFSESDVANSNLAASFTEDGSRVLGASPDISLSLRIWDTQSGDVLNSVPLESGVMSADGSRVAGWAPGLISVYEVQTGQGIMAVGLGDVNANLIDVAFTPDGLTIVAGENDNVVRMRDATTGEVVLEMAGHAGPIRQVRVGPDGRYALTASDDGTARLWGLDDGQMVRIFPGHDGRPVTAVAFSADGAAVAIGSSDGTVLVSPVSQSDITQQICSKLGRDLTDEERVAYGIEGTTPTCP